MIGLVRRACVPAIAALALCADVPVVASSAQPPVAVIRAVQTEAAGDGGAVVSVEADGALPAPVVGVLNDPPRIYLDFKGVMLGRGAAAAGASAVLRGVRLSQYSRRPSVVRIVFDLEAQTPYRIDTSGQAGGRVTVMLSGRASAMQGDVASQPVRPGEAAATPGLADQGRQAHARTASATGPARARPTEPARPRDADRYVAQVSAVLTRLHRARATVGTIASAGGLTAGELQALASELDENTQLLRTVKAPASLATPHDLLMRFCALGGRAARLRLDAGASADSGAVQNAASAAAGALIVLDRASRDLAYVPPQ